MKPKKGTSLNQKAITSTNVGEIIRKVAPEYVSAKVSSKPSSKVSSKISDNGDSDGDVAIVDVPEVNLTQQQISMPDALPEPNEKINVAIRVRPLLDQEIGKEEVVFCTKNNQIRVSDLQHTV